MEENRLTHNPNFVNLEQEENAEIRFFCEAFSLVDAVTNSSLLLGFSKLVNQSKDGGINWIEIPDLFPDSTKSASYTSSIARVGELIDQVVRKGWISPMRTKSLGALAAEAYRYHKNDSKTLIETDDDQAKNAKKSNSSNNRGIKRGNKRENVSDAWKEVSRKLQELAQYQAKNMSYHEDFQKENYLPHPDSWKVYTGTFTLILVTLLYALLL